MVSHRKDISIKEIMYDPMFVPETKKIDDLLKELQVHRVQMAIVIDEYSSFVGIVTVEDILEELVGEIMDEYDKEEPEVQNSLRESTSSTPRCGWRISTMNSDSGCRSMNPTRLSGGSSSTGSATSRSTRGRKWRSRPGG